VYVISVISKLYICTPHLLTFVISPRDNHAVIARTTPKTKRSIAAIYVSIPVMISDTEYVIIVPRIFWKSAGIIILKWKIITEL